MSAAEPVSKLPLELTDADLVTAVESVSFFDSINVLFDGRDPTTAKDTGDDPGGYSDNAKDDGRRADGGTAAGPPAPITTPNALAGCAGIGIPASD